MNHPIPSPAPWQWPSLSDAEDADSVESVIRGLASERLFFDPGETSSILTTTTTSTAATSATTAKGACIIDTGVPYKETVAMSLDSTDPCADFRRSMEEMVETHGLKDWAALEDLLGCYLKVNCKANHVYIVTAFVELLLTLSFVGESSNYDSSSSCNNNSFTISPSSDLPSSPLSLSQLLDQDNS